MYGMIHQAAERMAVEKFGTTRWQAIRDQAGLTSDCFIGFEYYPDRESMSLIRTIAQAAELSEEEVLFQLGHHWVAYAASSAYGRAISMAGTDLYGFFCQLDRMHAAVKSNLPRADLPSFVVESGGSDRFDLHYRSSREGLQPFVHGLIHAIAASFGEEVEATRRDRPRGATFSIRRTGGPGVDRS